jgi:hypothetical protein
MATKKKTQIVPIGRNLVVKQATWWRGGGGVAVSHRQV